MMPTIRNDAANSDANGADVVIVGFGFAGAHAATTLLRKGRSVTVVEPTGTHQFLTRLAAVGGGTQPAADRSVGIGDMFDVPVIADQAASVDDGIVTLESGDEIEGRYVLLTAGASPAEAPIDGLRHALPLRSADDAVAIRKAVETSDRITIVGGGPTGCQLAGAIGATHPSKTVTIVDGSDRLMSNFGCGLGRRARSILEHRGVDVVLGDEAAKIAPGGVTLESGREIEGAVIWAAGFEARMDAFGPTEDGGRLVVDRYGRVDGTTRVFAAGDAAAHRDRHGELYAMSAQIAAQAGKQVGQNLARLLDGRGTSRLDLHDLGWVVDLGGGAGVAELVGLQLANPLFDRVVPLLHDGIDLRNLWQLGGLDFVRRFRSGAIDDDPRMNLVTSG